MLYYNQLEEIKKNTSKNILLLGFGKENKQFYTWLTSEFLFPTNRIVIADLIQPQNLDNNFNGKIVYGEKYLDCLEDNNISLVFKSPGIWSLKPELEKFRSRNGIGSVLSNLVFFVERYRDQIIGVTGTKGKTTTCSLIKHFLTSLDYQVEYCGNTTNISPYNFWNNEKHESVKKVFVLELSSFQLQDLGYSKISPKYSLITNLFTDHLDQHKDINEYWMSKVNILKYQIVDDSFICNQETKLQIQKLNIEYLSKNILIKNTDISFFKNRIKSKLLGDHNLQNIIMAVLICESMNENLLDNLEEVNCDFYNQSLTSFNPIQGRTELISNFVTKEGVFFQVINDNASTEPHAGIAALASIADDTKIWLIVGGKNKEFSLIELVQKIISLIQVKKLICISAFDDVGFEIKNALANINLDIVFFDNGKENMKDFLLSTINNLAFLEFFKNTEKVTILFSPSGSSFNEFKNYLERQDYFLDWAQRLTKSN
jgi:UDP-N-acetylmuramoyl-L-alanine---L-glutamate ligase